MSARSFDINLTRKQGNIQVFKELASLVVRLHGHAVVIVEQDRITLSSCGWKTNTTKTAINNALKQLGLQYGIFQKKGIWYLSHPARIVEFNDGMTINRG